MSLPTTLVDSQAWLAPRQSRRRVGDRFLVGFRYVVCDVFTAEPLAGNQVAVFTDAREIPEHQLQRLAREMNFSETTFVYPPESDGHVRMRIFTPASEVPKPADAPAGPKATNQLSGERPA